MHRGRFSLPQPWMHSHTIKVLQGKTESAISLFKYGCGMIQQYQSTICSINQFGNCHLNPGFRSDAAMTLQLAKALFKRIAVQIYMVRKHLWTEETYSNFDLAHWRCRYSSCTGFQNHIRRHVSPPWPTLQVPWRCTRGASRHCRRASQSRTQRERCWAAHVPFCQD